MVSVSSLITLYMKLAQKQNIVHLFFHEKVSHLIWFIAWHSIHHMYSYSKLISVGKWAERTSSVECVSTWYADSCGFDPDVQQHSLVEIGREIISTAILGERGGSVVECRTPEREVGGSIPTAAVLCP